MKIINAKVFDIDKFTERDICIQDGMITADSYDDKVIDAHGLYAIPGLIDIHFHGAAGADFSDGKVDAIKTLAEYEASKGVVAICPATMTYHRDRLLKIMRSTKEYISEKKEQKKTGAFIIGINLEGPFINRDKAGAQNTEYVIPADINLIDELEHNSGNMIKLIDIAPECPGNMDFICNYNGDAHISIAHTNCDYDTAIEAYEKGADHITHLYNAMPGLNHRNPGPIAAAAEKRAYAEIITDGIHVHPAMVRQAFNLFGRDRMILISDSIRACGLGDGNYDLGDQEVRVTGNKATLAKDPATIAGSVTNLYDCMRIAVSKMGIPLVDAVCAATYNPARSIGADTEWGSFLPGRKGVVLLINEELEIVDKIGIKQLRL